MTSHKTVPIFGGQGIASMRSKGTAERALQDAKSPLGQTLLQSYHAALCDELSTLEADDELLSSPQSLLEALTKDKYKTSPLVSGMALFTVQTLRYLHYITKEQQGSATSTPTSSWQQLNVASVSGLSSGIFTAWLVASSASLEQYLCFAAAIFRVVVRLGIHCSRYRKEQLAQISEQWRDSPWSVVLVGLPRDEVEVLVSSFNAQSHIKIAVTVVINDKCITVAGRPDILQDFVAAVDTHRVKVHETEVNCLYHVAAHRDSLLLASVVDEVLLAREINLPGAPQLCMSLLDSATGQPVATDDAGSVVHSVLEMVLAKPVDWPAVCKGLLISTMEESGTTSKPAIKVLNFGPGPGLARSTAAEWSPPSTLRVDLDDVSLSSPSLATPPPTSNLSGDFVQQEPIAIVGMSLNMPGARNAHGLWQVLEQQLNTVSEVPTTRFNVTAYNDPQEASTKRKMKAHTANFIDNFDQFDHKFFQISPREAKSMDPQQRILLQTAYEALEDSGFVPEATSTFQRETFGCYVGVATNDYVQNLRNAIDVYYSTGTLPAFLAGRISFALKLSGPSVVVDTACSSSIVALYQACRALSFRDCNAAVAGGVNIITSPDMMLGLDRAHFLSATGQCKPFDASADGYSRSEGCGMFVLKRLSDAVNENDRILGVIRGIEVNQSGNAESITHPHAPTQVRLFEKLLQRCQIAPQTVNMIEAHGTGTQAGDPNEVASLRQVFAKDRDEGNPLFITSVKANIGHLEAASGAAGLAKLLLMMEKQRVPAVISLKTLNSSIAPLASDHTVIPTEMTEWRPARGTKLRRALLNNFGAAGSNGALLLEEYHRQPRKEVKRVCSTPNAATIALSAKTAAALGRLRDKYIDFLTTTSEDVSLLDLEYTSTARRIAYPFRMAISADSKEEATMQLRRASIPTESSSSSPRIAFVFSGQGGFYAGAAKDLYQENETFKRAIDRCDQWLGQHGFLCIKEALLGTREQLEARSVSEQTEVVQTAIFALEYALATMYMSFGMQPSCLMGHSIGEYAALTIAGVVSLEDALKLVASRARLMVAHVVPSTTGMIALEMDVAAVDALLERTSPPLRNLSVSCINSATSCVMGGPIEELHALKAHLSANAICKCKILDTFYAFHTVAMEPLVEEMDCIASSVSLHAPRFPLVSNVDGSIIEVGDGSVIDAAYFGRHCRETVQFARGIDSVLERFSDQPIAAWLELGPHPTTLPMIRGVARGDMLPALRNKGHYRKTQAATLASLFALGFDLDWRAICSDTQGRCIALPTYPFDAEGQRHYVKFVEEDRSLPSIPSDVLSPPKEEGGDDDATCLVGYSMLGRRLRPDKMEAGRLTISFESSTRLLAPFIEAHNVCGYLLCPASVYHEMVLSGLKQHRSEKDHNPSATEVSLKDVEFVGPLLHVAGVVRMVRVDITFADSEGMGDGTFQVSSTLRGGGSLTDGGAGSSASSMHCKGRFTRRSNSHLQGKLQQLGYRVERDANRVQEGVAETISTRTMYQIIFPRVVTYAPKYHSVIAMSVHGSGREALANVCVPVDKTPGDFAVHPVFMDTMLHTAGFVANMAGGPDDAYICARVGSVRVLSSQIDYGAPLEILVSLLWLPQEGVMLADAVARTVGDEEKVVVSHLKQMHFKKVKLASLQRAFKTVLSSSPLPPARAKVNQVVVVDTAAQKRTKIIQTTLKEEETKAASTLLDEIMTLVSTTVGVPRDSLEPLSNLEELGVDSLMTIEIQSQLLSRFPGIHFSAHGKTPADLANDIVRQRPHSDDLRIGSVETARVTTTTTLVSTEPCLASMRIADEGRGYFDAATPSPGSSSTCWGGSVASHASSPPGTAATTPGDPMHLSRRNSKVVGASVAHVTSSVSTILANVLDVALGTLDPTIPLRNYGLDSLTSIEAVHALAMQFGDEKLPHDLLSDSTTLEQLSQRLASLVEQQQNHIDIINPSSLPLTLPSTSTNTVDKVKLLVGNSNPTLLVRGGASGRHDALPLFVVHDGSGLVNYYKRLEDIGRDVWGIHSPHLVTGNQVQGVEALARDYITLLRSQYSGEFLLGGWSFGGVVAFEMARQLAQAGQHCVKGLVLIDAPGPIGHVPLSEQLIERLALQRSFQSASDLETVIKRQFKVHSSLLGGYRPEQAVLGGRTRSVFLRSSKGIVAPPGLQVPDWLANRTVRDSSLRGWTPLLEAPLPVLDIPGNHFETFEPVFTSELSQKLKEACDSVS